MLQHTKTHDSYISIWTSCRIATLKYLTCIFHNIDFVLFAHLSQWVDVVLDSIWVLENHTFDAFSLYVALQIGLDLLLRWRKGFPVQIQ